MNIAYNMDCLEAMRKMPDNAFDLSVVDPPYGAGFTDGGGCQGWFSKYHQGSSQKVQVDHLHSRSRERERREEVARTGGTGRRSTEKIIAWDTAPGEDYFKELFRVSRNQIIWGGNYFSLPPTRCFLVWRKLSISENFSMAMAEYAWTSFNGNAKVFEYAPQDSTRFHPTQKPKALYDWIFKLYAKPGMKILDTHLGSGSSRIAAYDAGLDFVGYEIDKEYFDKAEERFRSHTAQMDLLHWQQEQEPEQEPEQMELFGPPNG